MLSLKDKQALWQVGVLVWKLHAAQLLIYKSVKALPPSIREALIFCARRFGKTYLGVIMALEDALQNPGVNVFIIGPTRRQTSSIVRPVFRKILVDAPEGLVTPTSQDKYKLSNGSEIILTGFDSALESMRGADAFSIYLEETGLGPADPDEYSYMFKSVYRPTLQHSRGRMTHLTTPALLVDHPLHTDTLPQAAANGAFFRYTIEDNPLLTKEAIAEEIEELGGRNSPHTKRELFCEIVRDSTLVAVPAFDEDNHTTDLVYHQQFANYLVAGDFGGAQDLHFWLLIMYSHEYGVPVVMDERWWEASTPSKIIQKEISEAWDTYTTSRVMDAPSQVRIDMCSEGFSTFLPQKARFEDTVTYIRSKFYLNQVVVHKRCKKLIETLRSGTLNRSRTDWDRTVSLGHCDALMALVYGLRHVDRTFGFKPKGRSENTFQLKTNKPSKTLEDIMENGDG